MTESSNWEVAVLNAALELPTAERAAYLDGVCAGDPALRQRVEALLEAHEQAGSFMDAPAHAADGRQQSAASLPRTETGKLLKRLLRDRVLPGS